MTFPGYILASLAAYLLGSISPGIILSRSRGTDIRSQGSKSTGATNMTRVMGFRYGLITFLGDIIKATISVLLGRLIAGQPGALLAGLFVVIGHNWPAYYQFKGGKGIACSVAVLLWICPSQALIGCAAAVVVIIITRYVSLGSLALLLLAAMLIIIDYPFWPTGTWSLVLLALGLYQHRANISRLMTGTESKLIMKSTGKK